MNLANTSKYLLYGVRRAHPLELSTEHSEPSFHLSPAYSASHTIGNHQYEEYHTRLNTHTTWRGNRILPLWD